MTTGGRFGCFLTFTTMVVKAELPVNLTERRAPVIIRPLSDFYNNCCKFRIARESH
jgi:hypothetical protein